MCARRACMSSWAGLATQCVSSGLRQRQLTQIWLGNHEPCPQHIVNVRLRDIYVRQTRLSELTDRPGLSVRCIERDTRLVDPKVANALALTAQRMQAVAGTV